MLQIAHLINGARTAVHIHVRGQCVAVGAIDFSIFVVLTRFANMLRWHSIPLFGQGHHCAGIHQSVSELMTVLATHTIQCPATFLFKWSRSRCVDHQILHITPSEIRICLERQCANAGSQRCRCRCTRMLHCAYVIGSQTSIHVHCGDTLVMTRCTRTVCRCKRRRTLFQIPRLEAAGSNRKQFLYNFQLTCHSLAYPACVALEMDSVKMELV